MFLLGASETIVEYMDKVQLAQSGMMTSIIQSYRQHVSISALARQYGVTDSTLRQALLLCGVRLPSKYPIHLLDQALSEYELGSGSLESITDHYPFGYQTLYNHILFRYGFDYEEIVEPNRHRGGQDAESLRQRSRQRQHRNDCVVLQAVRDGAISINDIVDVTGLSRSAVESRIRRGVLT